VNRRHLALGAGVGTAAAIALAVLAARHATLADVSPVTPRGEWETVWVVAVTAAVVLSALGWLLARSGALRLRSAVAIAVVIQCLPLAGPLLLSKDAYLYWAVSRIVTVHHANPYTATLEDFPTDPAFPYPSEAWRSYPAAYGPAWEVLQTVPAAAAGSSAHRAERAYRVFAAIGILLIVALVAFRTRRAASVALIGWSPLVALHYGGGGHSDAWMMAFLVFAVAWPASAATGAAWAVAGSFKPVPVILLPLELARTRLRRPRSWWIGIVVTTLLIAVASTVFFGRHWLTDQGRGIHRGAGYPTPLGAVHWLTELGLTHGHAVTIAGVAFATVYVLLLREAWVRGRRVLSLGATALTVTSTLLGPWYGLWSLALAAVEEVTLAEVAALALAAYLLLADAVHF
jgi:hypothetical protein